MFLIETLKKKVSSEDMEDHEFEKWDESSLKTILAFLQHQDSNAKTELVVFY